MNVIKLNNLEYEVLNYNKNTYFSGETINSNANFSINANNISTLNTLAEEHTPITSIIIEHDGVVIYTLNNINAKIESINEYLNSDRMSINVNLIFDISEQDVI